MAMADPMMPSPITPTEISVSCFFMLFPVARVNPDMGLLIY
jgi:hypothetical protein